MESLEIINNEQQQQFQVRLEGELAYLEYRLYKGDIALMHTEVPEKLSGRGIASALAEYAIKYAREKKIPVMVYCPFVASWLKKHPENRDVLDPKYRDDHPNLQR
jgi:predicted GNAT family acetyltransferase